MATMTLTKTISASDLTRAVAALKARYGMAANATNAQVQAEFEADVWRYLKGIVRDYEAKMSAEAAAAAVQEIALT